MLNKDGKSAKKDGNSYSFLLVKVVFALFFLVGAVTVFGFYTSKVQTNNAAKAEVSAKEAWLSKFDVKKVSQEQKAVGKFLHEKETTAEINKKVELARKSKLTVVNISSKQIPGPAGQDLKAIASTLKVKGSWANLRNFLNDFETDFGVVLTGCNISLDSKDGDLDVTVDFNTYFKK